MLCATFKEKCYVQSEDDLILYQKSNVNGPYYSKSAQETPLEKRDYTYVFPYEYDQSNPVEKNFCPSCNFESLVGVYDESVLEELRENERFLKENRLTISDNLEKASTSVDIAEIQALQQKEFEEKMKLMEQRMLAGREKATAPAAANPLADLFKKNKKIVIIVGVVFYY